MKFEDKQTGKTYDDKFTVMQGLHDQLIKTKEENEKLRKIVDFYMFKWEHRKNYMKNYMAKARADGRVKHWRKYKNEN
tara:strand:+ start:1331 stop:1564 length:234 start_codon:yes stop_codon:yes gene_type:complete